MKSDALPRRVRPFFAAFAALLLGALMLIVPAAPANAHWELVESSPAADSAVETLPTEVSLTFSGAILPDTAYFEVTDESGVSLLDGTATVTDSVVTQALTGTATGVINVVWQVTYSDGHPADGTFAFTVTAPPEPVETATPEETVEPVETAAPEETTEPVETTDALITPTPEQAASPLPWIIGGLVVVVAGAVIYLLASRARRQKALEAARGGGDQDRDER